MSWDGWQGQVQGPDETCAVFSDGPNWDNGRCHSRSPSSRPHFALAWGQEHRKLRVLGDGLLVGEDGNGWHVRSFPLGRAHLSPLGSRARKDDLGALLEGHVLGVEVGLCMGHWSL